MSIVGRVYEAGVLRAWRGEGRDPEKEITQVLKEQAGLIQNGLQGLKRHAHFDLQAAGEIVQLHGDVTEAIRHRSGNFLASFVSKYLHFHSPIVPIFDSNARAAIGSFVDWKLVYPVRKALTAPPEGTRDDRNFVAAFVVLYWACAETTPEPTVKRTGLFAVATEMNR